VPAFALARRLRAGETVYAAWCMMGSPIVAETIAREGFSVVVLDAQHGLWDTASIITGIGAVSHADATPVVRIPLNDLALVSRALDFGAEARTAPADYLREANEGTLTLAMIETATALGNVDKIAATPGIDGLFVGPYDLATALSGGKAQDTQAPQVEQAIAKICAAAKTAGKIPGIYCRDAEGAVAMTKRGFRFVVAGNDHTTLRAATVTQLKALKG